MQRDCLGIAKRLVDRGHNVTIFCCKSEGAPPPDIKLVCLPNRALFNHNRNLRFSRAMARATENDFDVVVGFNKIPHLDILYCADPPIPKPRNILQKINPRVRGYERLDLTCFGDQSETRLLLLADYQMNQFRERYRTDPSRMRVLPPTIERKIVMEEADGARARSDTRRRLGLSDEALVWLFVGRYPQSKGLDRIIDALGAVPAARCICVGFDPAELARNGLGRLATQHGVSDRLMLLGHASQMSPLIAASDLLVHPSRKDVTGTVILEALANGLPVITTEACGYAAHVIRADAGIVIPGTFNDAGFRAALVSAQDAGLRAGWRRNALDYAAREDLYSGLDCAVAEIEETGRRKLARVHSAP